MNSETERAVQFLLSLRGRIVLAQALKHGIKQMSKVKGVHRESSNIDQMKYLLENVALDIE
jgi:hypothetical protein